MSNIWVPKFKIIEARDLISVRPRVQGFFKLEAIRPNGRRRVLADWFPNLITNTGLDRIGTDNDWMAACRVGSGSTTPAVTDTGMAAQVAFNNTVELTDIVAQATPPYYSATTRVYRFNAGVAEGNLAEVGIATAGASGGGSIQFSRALILDGDGDPTVITVLADEVLDVTYQCRIYPPLVDVTGSVAITGSGTHDYTLRAMNVTDSIYWALPASAGNGIARVTDGAIGAITSGPSGSSIQVFTVADSYSPTTYTREATGTWGLDEANFGGGISAAYCTFGGTPGSNTVLGAVQMDFDPPIMKDDTMTLGLTFSSTWARGTI